MGVRTLALGGDVMLGRLVDASLATRAPDEPWREILPIVESADAFVFNLECAVCGDLPRWEPEAKTFHFRLDPAHVETLAAAGVDAVQLANNHAMDHGTAGLLETLDHLDALGVAFAGAGRDVAAARAPAFIGDLALIAAADHLVEWGAGPASPGIFLVDPASERSTHELARAIADARDAGARHVVVGLHWGPNMRRVPPPHFERFAHSIVAAGADVVWGTSAHLFQGIEFHRSGVILYDAGDLLDDYAVDGAERNDLSFVFVVDLHEARVRLHPVRIADRRVGPALDPESEWLASRMDRLCAPFGSRLTREGRTLVVEPWPNVPGI